MHLNVLTKFNFAVGAEVKFLVEDEFRPALCDGDPSFDCKHVMTEHLSVHYFYNEDQWNVMEWRHVVCGSVLIFDGVVVSFNFGDMLILRDNIDEGTHIC